MIDKYFDGEVCSFCGAKLVRNNMRYNEKKIPCFECKSCHSYFYEKRDYELLKEYAKKERRGLNTYIYSYTNAIKEKNLQKKKKKAAHIKQKTNTANKKKNKTYPKTKINGYTDPKIITVTSPKIRIDSSQIACSYLKKNHCQYMDAKCNPLSVKCKNYTGNKPVIVMHSIKPTLTTKATPEEHQNTSSKIIKDVGVSVIVLTANRKCIIKEHEITDVEAVVRIASPDGSLLNHKMPAAYCEVCNLYFAIMSDYLKAKELGTLLCQVVDRTEVRVVNGKIVFRANESKMHRLGYNVKKNNDLTTDQRRVILANMIENNLVSKHEAISNISASMKRHINQKNYAQATAAWKSDLDFLRSYHEGDLPQVRVKQIILGRR